MPMPPSWETSREDLREDREDQEDQNDFANLEQYQEDDEDSGDDREDRELVGGFSRSNTDIEISARPAGD